MGLQYRYVAAQKHEYRCSTTRRRSKGQVTANTISATR